MGKHSNIILIDNDGMIIGSLKAIHSHLSSKRQIRAGLAYQLPPPEDKLTPRPFSRDDFASIFHDADPDEKISGLFVKTFKAMSPSWAATIAHRADLGPTTLCSDVDSDVIAELYECYLQTLRDIESGLPLDTFDIGDVDTTFPINYSYATLYGEISSGEQLEKRRSRLLKVIRRIRKPTGKLLEKIEKDLKACEKRDDHAKGFVCPDADTRLADRGGRAAAVRMDGTTDRDGGEHTAQRVAQEGGQA